MKKIFSGFAQSLTIAFILLLTNNPAPAETKHSAVLVKGVSGAATFSSDGKTWLPLRIDSSLEAGVVIKTGSDGAVDFILQYSSTVMRLLPESEVTLARLDHQPVEEFVISDTALKLTSGSIIGSQRKLSRPSRFNIVTPGGVTQIVGTEYLVRADGAVTVLSGEVTLSCNAKNGGDVQATVSAGQSFDPATGKVVTTTAAFLKNIIADVDSVRENAETYKAGKSTVVVKHHEKDVSPHKCDDDGHGKDDDKGGKDKDGGRGDDKGGGKGDDKGGRKN